MVSRGQASGPQQSALLWRCAGGEFSRWSALLLDGAGRAHLGARLRVPDGRSGRWKSNGVGRSQPQLAETRTLAGADRIVVMPKLVHGMDSVTDDAHALVHGVAFALRGTDHVSKLSQLRGRMTLFQVALAFETRQLPWACIGGAQRGLASLQHDVYSRVSKGRSVITAKMSA